VEEYERLTKAAGVDAASASPVTPEAEDLMDRVRATHRSTLDKLALE